MNLPLILVVVVLAIYLLWKLMGPSGHRNRRRRFEIGRHRRKTGSADEPDDDDDDN